MKVLLYVLCSLKTMMPTKMMLTYQCRTQVL